MEDEAEWTESSGDVKASPKKSKKSIKSKKSSSSDKSKKKKKSSSEKKSKKSSNGSPKKSKNSKKKVNAQGLQQAIDYGPPTETLDETREIVKAFISTVWNRGEDEYIRESCDPSLRFSSNTHYNTLNEMVVDYLDSLADFHCEIHSMVVEPGQAFCRLQFTGKHTEDEFQGCSPNGKLIAWKCVTEFVCRHGKIMEIWILDDVKSLEQQLRATS